LHSFALAIGLAASSTAPTWRDASLALVALSGLYLILAALISYGIGGYVAGRMRRRVSGGTLDEIEFRDGVHGAGAWALATLLTALIAFGGAQSLTRLAAPSSGSAGASTSVGGENIRIRYRSFVSWRASRRQYGVHALRGWTHPSHSVQPPRPARGGSHRTSAAGHYSNWSGPR
jgi:hypothetical protein